MSFWEIAGLGFKTPERLEEEGVLRRVGEALY
jgi:hypothetical protein